jgi:uncharacterized protein YlzI (FlbEa/FlbD family)
MITLHRLAHSDEPFHLNPDLILTIEAMPDTVVTLTTGTKMVVAESPEEVVEAVVTWRTTILTSALRDNPRRMAGLALVRGTSGDGDVATLHFNESETNREPRGRR